MGALKLTYYEAKNPLKVVYSKSFEERKSVQRFLSVDPLTKSYPWYTPYQFAGNQPIMSVDVDGLENQVAIDGTIKEGPFNMEKINDDIAVKLINATRQIMSQKPSSPSAGSSSFIGPNPNRLESVSETKARMNGITLDRAIEESNLVGKRVNPFVYGGGEFGYGFAETTAEAMKEAPLMLAQEFAVAKFTQMKQLYKFKDGASRLASSVQLERGAGRLTYGKESLFVSPTSEIDNLLSQGLSREEIATKLGITDPAFQEGDLIKITISPKAMKNLRFPNGAETGANSLFKAGGKTSGGVTEAVIDPVKKGVKGVKEDVVVKR